MMARRRKEIVEQAVESRVKVKLEMEGYFMDIYAAQEG